MQLFVNNELINFELENEKTLHDLLPQLFYYLKCQGLYELSAELNDKTLDLTNEAWHTIDLTSVEKLSINGRLVLEIEPLIGLLRTAIELINQEKQEPLELVVKRWGEVSQSLQFWLIDFNLGDSYFTAVESASLFFNQKQSSDLTSQAVKLLELSINTLEEKDRELNSPLEEMTVAIHQLKDFEQPFRDLTRFFQKGQDRKAMQLTLQFVESFQKFIRLCAFIPETSESAQAKIGQFMQTIAPKINDFTKACEEKDFILAGDLAEYELAENLTLLDDIEKELGKI